MRTLILCLLFAAALAAAPIPYVPPPNSGTLELNLCDMRGIICLPRLLDVADYDTDVKWRASVVEVKVRTDDGKGRVLVFPLTRIADAVFTPKGATR